jgi:excisionase family DNA binding protein
MTEIQVRLQERIKKDNPLFLTPTEFATILGCTRHNVHYHIQSGNLKATRLGNALVIAIAEVKRFVK